MKFTFFSFTCTYCFTGTWAAALFLTKCFCFCLKQLPTFLNWVFRHKAQIIFFVQKSHPAYFTVDMNTKAAENVQHKRAPDFFCLSFIFFSPSQLRPVSFQCRVSRKESNPETERVKYLYIDTWSHISNVNGGCISYFTPFSTTSPFVPPTIPFISGWLSSSVCRFALLFSPFLLLLSLLFLHFLFQHLLVFIFFLFSFRYLNNFLLYVFPFFFSMLLFFLFLFPLIFSLLFFVACTWIFS